MLVNGMRCYFPGWDVSKRDGVLLTGWDVSIWDRVLRNGIEVSIWDNVLVYRMSC